MQIGDTKIAFISFYVNVLLQMKILKKKFEFDNFYRDPKKCFSLLGFSLLDWRKVESIRERRYKKE